MTGYYDRTGEPIPSKRWSELLEQTDYRVVAQTKIGEAVVSTVWLGLNHRFSDDGPPLIFETMVFRGGTSSDESQVRYSSEADALLGHGAVVAELMLAQRAVQ